MSLLVSGVMTGQPGRNSCMWPAPSQHHPGPAINLAWVGEASLINTSCTIKGTVTALKLGSVGFSADLCFALSELALTRDEGRCVISVWQGRVSLCGVSSSHLLLWTFI